jgi:hypothetical protein
MNPVVNQHSWESKAIPAGGRPDERLAVVVATAAGCRLAAVGALFPGYAAAERVSRVIH